MLVKILLGNTVHRATKQLREKGVKLTEVGEIHTEEKRAEVRESLSQKFARVEGDAGEGKTVKEKAVKSDS